MKLNVLSAGAAKGLVGTVETIFKARTGADISGIFSAVGAIQDRFLANEPCDVLILSQKMLEDLQNRGGLLAGNIAPLGAVSTAVAVRDGMASPSIATGAQLAETLKASDAIYIPDPELSTAGRFFVQVLKTLGIERDVASCLRPFPNGATAMRHLAESTDARAIGCTQITEIIYTPGIKAVGPLPKGYDLSTVYSAATSAKATTPDLASAFVVMLTGPTSAILRTEAGFESVG
jgi:molybdate transport system substrate-binding protein